MAVQSQYFYNQPIAHRFGNALRTSLSELEWHTFDVSVAWVRQAGTKHLITALTNFLERGGSASFCVGLDSQNTSIEGLESLLSLNSHGIIQTYVYHNEASVLFHPKVYLLTNTNKARLIVGSNNFTEAGLFRNVEAGLQIDTEKSNPVIYQTFQAFASWRDTSSPFVRILDDILLKDLILKRYIFPEKSLRKEASAGLKKFAKSDRLFGFQEISVPAVPSKGIVNLPSSSVGSVLLMRVRRASLTERRTQVQIPIKVVSTGFFGKDATVTSAHDGRTHTLTQLRQIFGRRADFGQKWPCPER